MNEIKVTFLPSKENVYVLPGTTVLEAAERGGILIENPCAGAGTCGKCKVKIVSGRTEQELSEHLTEKEIQSGYCLACQTRIIEDCVVEVPRESLAGELKQILSSGEKSGLGLSPAVEKQYFELQPPSRADFVSDLSRLRAAIGECEIPYPVLKNLPTFFRSQDWRGTATKSGGKLISIEAGDTRNEIFGIALDLGTTTIVGALFDLSDGEELAVSAVMNPQTKYGADVISRINLVRKNGRNLEELHHASISAINSVIKSLAKRAGVAADRIYHLAIAGNSTMQEILLGMDPSALGELPFVQAFKESQTVPAGEIGIDINPHAEILVFPQIGGFVGGDTVAAMATTVIDERNEPTLIIDIGTNGEIVLANGKSLLAASAAAGPALEGAKISQGMRAADGAIEKVVFENGKVIFNVIGNQKPRGICGSALIDIVAELLRCGILSEAGRIKKGEDIPDTCHRDLVDRIVECEKGVAFEIASAADSAGQRAIHLRQKDVSELQLAVGAIRAGTEILIEKSGIDADDLGSVLLAGAFGNYIRINNARRIGLIPQLPDDKIHFIGNAALYGAKKCLLVQENREYIDRLAEKTVHVDLSMDPDFQDHFATAMFFPAE